MAADELKFAAEFAATSLRFALTPQLAFVGQLLSALVASGVMSKDEAADVISELAEYDRVTAQSTGERFPGDPDQARPRTCRSATEASLRSERPVNGGAAYGLTRLVTPLRLV